jgi:putative FmdB family regulatory protein
MSVCRNGYIAFDVTCERRGGQTVAKSLRVRNGLLAHVPYRCAHSRKRVTIFFTLNAGRSSALPLYEYKCAKCAHQFEKIEKHNAPTTQKCPKCGGKAQRMISAAGIQFKGSGWYVTDYKGKSSGATSVEGSGDGASAKSGDSSSDSKSSDAKPQDSKSSDAKTGESKSGGGKSGESKSSSEKNSSKKKK